MSPEEVPEEHLIYLKRSPLPVEAPLFIFTHREQAVLESKGQWLKALAEGNITPLTPAQKRFVAVSKGVLKAETAYEKLWRRYQYYHPLIVSFNKSQNTFQNQIDFVAIDFETASRIQGSACSIGIARVEKGEVVETQHFLIRPEPFHFERGNISVHGIHPHDVIEAPDFAELWPNLLPYLEHQVVVAHNAQFDMGVLRNVLKQYDIPYPAMQYACTFQIARKAIRRLPRYGLAHLSNHFNIELNHHHAESDASACAQVLVNLCEVKEVSTLKGLFEACKYEPKILK